MKVKIYPSKAKEQSIEVPGEILAIKMNPQLVSQAVLRELGNRRRPIAHTKDRGEVSGGGRKPFRQKGTGRARAGSTRSPIWIGGGRVFGPSNLRNFSKRLPKKMLKKAILMALSEKFKNGKLVVVTDFDLKNIKTREVQDFLEKLPIEEGKILALLSKTSPQFELSAANLPYLKVSQIQNISLVDLLKYDYLLIDKDGLKRLSMIYGSKK